MMDWEHVPELVAVKNACDLEQQADAGLRAAVAAARAAGHSWELIGAALGITRQSAWEKYRLITD